VIAASPILAFTTEEVWRHLPRAATDPDSVHMAFWPDDLPARDSAIEVTYQQLFAIREAVNAALEPFRAQKHSSLDARALVRVPAAQSLAQYQNELTDLCIVSQLAIELGDSLSVEIKPAIGNRCPRCWKYTPAPPEQPCARCQAVLAARADQPREPA
jgi:isoleucyl-tRNA synthetase